MTLEKRVSAIEKTLRDVRKAIDKLTAKHVAYEQMASASEIGSKGGKKAAAAMTPEQRKARARKAAAARWGKPEAK